MRDFVSKEDAEKLMLSNEKEWRCPNCQGIHPIRDAEIVEMEIVEHGDIVDIGGQKIDGNVYSSTPIQWYADMPNKDGENFRRRHDISPVICSDCGRIEFFVKNIKNEDENEN